MKSRTPLLAAVVGALLIGGATTGTTYASWTDNANLVGDSITTGSMSFTATTPGAVTVDQVNGSTADTSFVLDDTSVGKNLKQRITATVASSPAGVAATVGTSCGSAGSSVFVDTTPTSADQTLCVRVTSSTTAVSGPVTINLSGAQRPSGWSTPVRSVSVTVNVQPAGLTLSCGGAVTPGPRYRITWNDVDADGYLVYRGTGPTGPWQFAGLTGSNNLQYVEDEWSQSQQSYFAVVAYKDWSLLDTSNVLSVLRNGNSNNFSCGTP